MRRPYSLPLEFGRHQQRGASLVEAAIIAPVIILIFGVLFIAGLYFGSNGWLRYRVYLALETIQVEQKLLQGPQFDMYDSSVVEKVKNETLEAIQLGPFGGILINPQISIHVPQVSGQAIETVLQQQPVTVNYSADFGLASAFGWSNAVPLKGRADGFVEHSTTPAMPPMLDCFGNPRDPRLPFRPLNCPCENNPMKVQTETPPGSGNFVCSCRSGTIDDGAGGCECPDTGQIFDITTQSCRCPNQLAPFEVYVPGTCEEQCGANAVGDPTDNSCQCPGHLIWKQAGSGQWDPPADGCWCPSDEPIGNRIRANYQLGVTPTVQDCQLRCRGIWGPPHTEVIFGGTNQYIIWDGNTVTCDFNQPPGPPSCDPVTQWLQFDPNWCVCGCSPRYECAIGEHHGIPAAQAYCTSINKWFWVHPSGGCGCGLECGPGQIPHADTCICDVAGLNCPAGSSAQPTSGNAACECRCNLTCELYGPNQVPQTSENPCACSCLPGYVPIVGSDEITRCLMDGQE